MARKTSVWLTGLVLVAALVTISLVGLKDVSAYKLDATQIAPQATKTAAVPAVKTVSNGQAVTISDIPQFIGQSKRSITPAPYANANMIEFSNGYKIDTDAGEPSLPADLRYDAPKGDELTYYIVQFNGPVQDSWRKGLEKAGAEVMFYLPNYAFVVRMNESIRGNITATKSEVKWTGLYQPAYKVSPRISAQAKGGKIRATILLFSPEDINVSIKSIESVVGHKIFHKSTFEWEPGKFNKKIFVDISEDKLSALANIKGVYWIEPMPVFRPLNYNSQVCSQNGVRTAGARPLWSAGIMGEGQIVQDLDTGCRESQYFFRDNAHRHAYVDGISEWYWDINHSKVVGQQPAGREDEIELGWNPGTMSRYGDENDGVFHGTHTSGSIAGNDDLLGSYGMDGMAKNAKLIFVDGGGDSGSVFGTWDINRVGSWGWDSAAKYLGGQRAYISSNSWGDSSANGVYDGSGMETDQFMWSHKDFLFLFSDDNDGTKTQPGSKAGSPAVNKNGVAVGATAAAGPNGLGGANTKATFSSWGRHADGRLNPTVVSPGVSILSADGSTDNGTKSMQGTSMSCPITAGATALLRQYFTEGWYPTGTKIAANGFIPSGAMMKAVLAISGDSTTSYCGTFYADSLFGWGRVNLDTALYLAGNGVKLIVNDNRTGLVTGDVAEYLLTLPAGATGLKIALNWTDYPGVPQAAKTLVNDLDLDAYNPSAVRYRGNRFNSVVPRQTNTAAIDNDSIDVLEGIKVVTPLAGTWRIAITGRNVAMGPQPFALVITYKTAVAAYPILGKVLLNKPVYGIPLTAGVGDSVKIELNDPNNLLASNNVTVYAKKVETTGETVTCTKVGDGLFRGSIVLLNGNPVNGDGRLSVDANDTIWVKYTDTSPAGTDSMYAPIDGFGCMITNVYSYDPTPPNASAKYIHWNSSENASSKIYYGPTTALGSIANPDTPYVTNHNVFLSGLASSTTYYFDVESKDFRGNTVRDDNGGAHYSFTTGSTSGSDVLIWMWDDDAYANSFIHADYLTSALNAGGWSYDWWSSQLNGPLSTSKLKGYKAVFVQIAQDGSSGGNYPAFTPAQRETLKLYHDGGARFALTGNDIAWDTWANQAPGPDFQADTIFCRNYLHFTYKGDLATNLTLMTTVYGAPSDPISGAYTAGVSHTAWRDGAGGDTINLSGSGVAGTGSYVWNMNGVADSCAIKWQSTANMTGGSGVGGIWYNQPTRVVMNAFEITQLEAATPVSATRIDILNKMFIWLIGHDHPDVTISTPVAGNTYTTSPISIAWTSGAYGGAAIDTTWVEYSSNGGSSWNQLAKGTAVTSPYSWNTTAITNGSNYQVRVRVNDKNLYPSMSGSDTVGSFTINRVGGDNAGPKILAGSIKFARSPVGNQAGNGLLVQAIASDSSTGLSNIAAVKCSAYVLGSARVSMLSATDGTFNQLIESVNGGLATNGWPVGTYTIYLRAQDASPSKTPANWGPLANSTINVISGISTPGAVTLSYFNYLASAQGITLKWRTESETNSEKWVITRGSSVVGPFATLKEVASAGSSNEPQEYSYFDASVDPSQRYYYQLIEVSTDGNQVVYGPIEARSLAQIISFGLSAARPNPFAGQAKINFQIPARSQVSLKIYNITGQLVRTLVNEVRPAGFYTEDWNGKNDRGQALSNGVYFYNLEAGNNQATKKITLIK